MSVESMTDRHGTYAEYQQHGKRGEKACDACAEANREYARKRRARQFNRERERVQNAARDRALWRLARLHPAQFRALVAEEVRKAEGSAPLA